MTYKRSTIHVARRQSLPGPNEQQFQVARPLATHFEAATCKAKNCPHYLNGWKTIVPTESSQAHYIRRESDRHFMEEKQDGGLVEFIFPPGQKCFRDHYQPLDKQEIYTHRTSEGFRVHERPQDWTENMNIEVDKIQRLKERG